MSDLAKVYAINVESVDADQKRSRVLRGAVDESCYMAMSRFAFGLIQIMAAISAIPSNDL
jgi:hypothetical protein